METMKVSVPDFSINSSWKCVKEMTSYGEWTGKYLFRPASTGSAKIGFGYSLPSGTRIVKAVIWATLGSPFTGASVVSVNEAYFSQRNGAEVGAVVTLTSTNASGGEKNDTTGRYGKGNIDLNNRIVVRNEDGSISTEVSINFYDEECGKEVLIPTIVNGKYLTDDQAIDYYYETGQYLGKFDTPEEAEEYATMLHIRQEWYYGGRAGLPFQAEFKFKANGKHFDDDKVHTAIMSFKNVYLQIDYEETSGETDDKPKTDPDTVFRVPPQTVCIYDPEDGSIYMFDGVAKIQHSGSMDIQEEPDDSKKKQYVNNAKNQPDKLTLDVLMSDVYTGGGSIIDNAGKMTEAQSAAFNATKGSLIARDAQNPWSRSENAFHTLHWLKEERRRLCVITQQYVYDEMILSTLTVNQDENTPFGWEGQIVFQHAFQKAPETNAKKTPTDTDTSASPPSESNLSAWRRGVSDQANSFVNGILNMNNG